MSNARALRVCFLIPGFGDGGAQKQCIQLLRALSVRADIDVRLIYYHEGVHSHMLRSSGINSRRIHVSTNYNPINIIKTRSELREFSPDVLLTWLHSCDVYGYFLRIMCPGLIWLMTERDSRYPASPKYWLRRFLGRFANGVICNSESGAAYWRGNGASQIFVVPNIVLPAARDTEPGRGDILFVGRLEEQKNPVVVVRAFCMLAKRRPDLSFLVVGEGSLRGKLEAIVQEEGAGDSVRLLGFRDDAAALIANARLVVSLSHHEGTPNVLLECVASGTLVAVSDIPEHRDLFGDHYPYYVSDRADPGRCAEVIEAGLACVDVETALSSARARTDQMTSSAVADAYANIFAAVAGKCSVPAAEQRVVTATSI